MKIAVTGASGFIGSALLDELALREYAEVRALGRAVSNRMNKKRLIWIATDYEEESLKEAIKDVDTIIHLAALRGKEQDTDRFAVNEKITSNIIDAVTHLGIRRLVFASTISVYNDENLMPWNENAQLQGRTAYGNSKIKCEKMIIDAAAGGDFSYGIARIAQVLGPGEKRRDMLKVFMDTAKNKGCIKVMGESRAKRQYVYVKDVARVMTDLACNDIDFGADKNCIVNVGMRDAYTNLEVAQMISAACDNKTMIDYDDSYAETVRPSIMDVSKLTDEIGFEPTDFEDALKDFMI